MSYEFHWPNNEANFGPPKEKEIDGGTHFTIEIILIHGNEFVAVRRPEGYPGHQLPPKVEEYPDGCLYFCHDLPRYGESLEEAVNRIMKNQIGLESDSIDVLDLEMHTYPDELHEDSNQQWAITLYVLADLSELPETSEAVTEVVTFDKNSIPEDMGWWEVEEMEEFIENQGL